jgi:hypothetical protein
MLPTAATEPVAADLLALVPTRHIFQSCPTQQQQACKAHNLSQNPTPLLAGFSASANPKPSRAEAQHSATMQQLCNHKPRGINPAPSALMQVPFQAQYLPHTER